RRAAARRRRRVQLRALLRPPARAAAAGPRHPRLAAAGQPDDRAVVRPHRTVADPGVVGNRACRRAGRAACHRAGRSLRSPAAHAGAMTEFFARPSPMFVMPTPPAPWPWPPLVGASVALHAAAATAAALLPGAAGWAA